MAETLEKIRDFLGNGQQHYIVTPNPEFVVLARKDKEFREILNQADLSVPDGIGIVWAARWLGKPLKERVVGVNLVERLMQLDVIARSPVTKYGVNFTTWQSRGLQKNDGIASPRQPAGLAMTGRRVFLLGGQNGAAEKIAEDWPQVVGFTEKIDEAVNSINRCQPDILLMALGAPKQEKWIAQNLSKIPSVKVAIGVGSAFDLISGQIKRAPKIFQALGLEWLWRLFREPWRWRKVWRSVIMFPIMVLRQKLLFSNSQEC